MLLFILLALILMLALAGCPNETPQPTPQPAPPPALVKYGDLTLSGGGTIPIYKTAAVTDAQMKALVDGKNVVQRIQAGYDGLDVGQEIAFASKSLVEIHIINNENYFYKNVNGKRTLGLKFDTSEAAMKSFLETVGSGTLPFVN